MLEGLQIQSLSSINSAVFIANLLTSLICGFMISYIYRWTYRGPHYSLSFVHSIVILPMVTTLVIIVIGNNLARAFGLVGAMSIIRFRTAVKDTQDIVVIFFSLASGMAAGVGMRAIAFIGTIGIGAVLLFLNRTNYAKLHKTDFLLQFVCVLEKGTAPYLSILENYCKESKLIHTQSMDQQDLFEIAFHVQLKSGKNSTDLVKELNNLREISEVRLYHDDE